MSLAPPTPSNKLQTVQTLLMNCFDDNHAYAQAFKQVRDGTLDEGWDAELIGHAAAYRAAKEFEQQCDAGILQRGSAQARAAVGLYIHYAVKTLIDAKGIGWIPYAEAEAVANEDCAPLMVLPTVEVAKRRPE